jgi:hypothetical protein
MKKAIKNVKELHSEAAKLAKSYDFMDNTCSDRDTFDSKVVCKLCKKMAKFMKKCHKMGLSDGEIYDIFESEL